MANPGGAPISPIFAVSHFSPVAREAGLKREAVRQVVIQNGWKSLRRTKVPLISAEGRERCAKRAAGLVNALKSKGRGTIVFFSDEKILRR